MKVSGASSRFLDWYCPYADTKTQYHCFLCLAQNRDTKHPSRTAEVGPWKLDWVRWLVGGVSQSQRPRPDGHVERVWGTPGRWWLTGRFLLDSGLALARHSLLSNLQMQWRWELVFSSSLFFWRIQKSLTNDDLPIKWMASGKSTRMSAARLSSTFRVLYWSSSSNRFGQEEDTLRTAVIPHRSRVSRLDEWCALPRKRKGRISTGPPW